MIIHAPINFMCLAKGNDFVFDADKKVAYEKTGQRSARRCDVTLPKLLIHPKPRDLVCWAEMEEV